jgi:hypothetical protein
MKRTLMLCIIVVLGLTFFYIHDSLSHSNSAPVIDCLSCHEGELKSDIVQVTGIPKAYTPGNSYKLRITVKSGLKADGESQGGFAVEATAGKLIASDKKNTQISGTVLTHTLEGSRKRTWEFIWQAPKTGEDVSITVMVVASNGDYSSFGEEIGAQSYSIKASGKASGK